MIRLQVGPKQLICPFCNGKLRATSSIERDPCFRCFDCSVRIQITNKSSLPADLYKFYWWLVENQQLTKQTWSEA